MVKRTGFTFCRVVLLAALVAVCAISRPLGVAAAETPQIAVLNVEAVLNSSNAGRSVQEQLKKIRSANQEKDQESEAALRTEGEQLMKQRAVLSEEAFATKQKELQSRFETLRQGFDERQQRIQSAVEKARTQIHQALVEATRDIAAERDIDIVLSQTATALTSKELDISKDVLDRLNETLSEIPLAVDAP
jgi:outer membrane protein